MISTDNRPLADRLRPSQLSEFVGHSSLLQTGSPLNVALSEKVRPPSLILWGPPGCGKTTLARMISKHSELPSEFLSAVTSSIKDIKELMSRARATFEATQVPTLLIIDEIHRFNRSQQDAFLPFVESGEIILVGTTTENPSFEINAALLSRMQVIQLQPLQVEDIASILKRAIETAPELGSIRSLIPDDIVQFLANLVEGDARRALSYIEALSHYLRSKKKESPLTTEELPGILSRILPRYDKNRDVHFDFISALHKSLRNSDVQASLYWMTRMLEAGEDPLYIARRLVRFATEDVGLASPEALTQALNAKDAVDFIGLPEGELALAQAVVYLATAPKSNALYLAMKKVHSDLESGQRFGVPLRLRNAPTTLMSELGYGKGYAYAHNSASHTTTMKCFPDEMNSRDYYNPSNSGFEKTIQQRMDYWDQLKKEPEELSKS